MVWRVTSSRAFEQAARIVDGQRDQPVRCGLGVETPPPPPPPPRTVNVQATGQQVVNLLRGQWGSEPLQKYRITFADSMTLINTDVNTYDGLATVYTRKRTQKFLSVNVWADPTGPPSAVVVLVPFAKVQ
jgi:hypothetical protein